MTAWAMHFSPSLSRSHEPGAKRTLTGDDRSRLAQEFAVEVARVAVRFQSEPIAKERP
jgi:hypothetical protein